MEFGKGYSAKVDDRFSIHIAEDYEEELKAIADANDGIDSDNINFFLDNVGNLTEIDTGDLPSWFTDATTSMIEKEVYTENQINNFLEI